MACTTLGSGIWNTLLIAAGWFLGDNWEVVSGYQKTFGDVVVAALCIGVVWFLGKRFVGKRRLPGKPEARA